MRQKLFFRLWLAQLAGLTLHTLQLLRTEAISAPLVTENHLVPEQIERKQVKLLIASDSLLYKALNNRP